MLNFQAAKNGKRTFPPPDISP